MLYDPFTKPPDRYNEHGNHIEILATGKTISDMSIATWFMCADGNNSHKPTYLIE